MTSDEKEALTFLYAYMPIGDITDYDGQLYLDNIRSSFRARVEMPWETAYRKTSSAISYFPCGSTTRIWTRAA